ncbi:OmpA family protein [Phaeodactylibacter luteus]|uniref:OmpA family protein n=1 Tax=Phaeodactylibacter luteus TaxID=1564516 RepID=A0A5C6RQ90_9BACT|nr:OmpA family protein [Phaeodactylibacter luteus]TXB64488.1 OmpA family protein [Phaeodactylibacter luteus]
MRFLAFLTFLAFLVFALLARWYFVCELRQACGPGAPVDARLQTLQLTEGEDVLLRGYDQLAFDSASLSPRTNANNITFLDTLAAILQARPNRNLTITALFRESEVGIAPGFFENLGLARADQLRKLLIKRGVPQDRFSLDYGISEDRRLREPALFNLYDPNAVAGGFEKVLFTFKNMTFSDANFAYNSAEFSPGASLRLYADSVQTYFSLNPDASMAIIGHTDSIGSDAYNLDLGLRRAESARAFFRDSLDVEVPIVVASEGESRPVAPNSTSQGADNPEGRQKNRRVNFRLLATPADTMAIVQ